MGSSISIDDTVAGQSLLTQTFKTNIPFYATQFMNCGVYENRVFLRDHPIINTKQHTIPQNTIFTVNHVEKKNSLIYVYIEINYNQLIIILGNSVSRPFLFNTINSPIIINTQLISII